ncbi:hypothetical protein QA649_08990 [Bradyrhizobium sp. CB1717]|uniref:alpha/beta fold hydrolase n=1 Tax=Bradyrhizobium sp. CB1717 TaxID=3039154 RepID=UPI0024B167AE|nr:alpha/beta fold hydrolase [Bradyrhizobium sp. CB1717]WFU26326.1 hypothetical protein QA649_08990 [Bradyrhizobium sp. CB1717]
MIWSKSALRSFLFLKSNIVRLLTSTLAFTHRSLRRLLRSRRRRITALFALLCIIFAFHRTPNRSFHEIGPKCGPDDICGSVEQEVGGPPLAFVEFDDQGAYFDQRQSFKALRLIRDTINASPLEVEVFVFVHGWQHNAHPKDAHVNQFRDFLRLEAEKSNGRRVVGVFIGWPGETLRFPLNVLTFWSRKAAAHRIASGAVQEFFATLRQVKADQQMALDTQLSEGPVPKMYVIGHSFGGLIVFQANSQSFALRYGADVIHNRLAPSVAGFGDLVVLINPAIEATRFASLHSLWSEYPNDPFYSPVMVAVGSEADWATRILFPLGVLGGTVTTNQVRPDQWRNALTTIGNSESFLTHNASIAESGEITVCERAHHFSQRKAPFWFLSASSGLINGHGDLNGEKLLNLFTTLQRRIGEKRRGGLESCQK